MNTIVNLPDVELAKLFSVTLIEHDSASVARFNELKAAVHRLYYADQANAQFRTEPIIG